MKELEEKVIALIKKTSTDLPEDVEDVLKQAHAKAAGVEAEILETILTNISLAREKEKPLCQDTGTPIFYVKHPQDMSQIELKAVILSAVQKATGQIPLRPNAVDPVSGKNSGDNIGSGIPIILLFPWLEKKVRIDLMMKGGGSENATFLYKLPDASINAGRDLNGVERCVLDAVWRTQGLACAPTIVGVGIGGLSGTSISLSQKQFFRKLEDKNPDQELADLEESLLDKLNRLGIGAMGLGGATTVLGVKAGKLHRHPASYFVAVSFMCWACRRGSMEVEL